MDRLINHFNKQIQTLIELVDIVLEEGFHIVRKINKDILLFVHLQINEGSGNYFRKSLFNLLIQQKLLLVITNSLAI